MQGLVLLNNLLIKKILQWDEYLFLKINTSYTNSSLDAIAPWYRESITWLPLYLFMLVFLFVNFGRKTWYWLLFAVFTIALSDQLSSGFIKHYFQRLRPCGNIALQGQMRLLLDYCSGGFSFTSSHATNHFALAMFITQSLKNISTPYKWFWFMWAASISYAQVYVGVHYPLDVFCGALVGCLIGYSTALIYNNKIATFFPLIPLTNDTSKSI